MELNDFFTFGGFAKFKEDIDGDFEAFNFCLAEEYFNAIYSEDFNAVGEIDNDLFDNICYWLNYNYSLHNEDEVKKLRNASLITINNRSIVDAIYEKCYCYLANVYINNGIFLPKLILAILLSDKEDCYVLISKNNENEIKKIFKYLHDFIEDEYKRNNDIEFLKKIKNNYSRIYVPKFYKLEKISSEYRFVKALKNRK